MKVTRIIPVTKNRLRILIDDEPAFVLYKGELRLYQIAEGQDITQENYESIMQEVLPKRAKLRAMNLLKSRNYTEEGLRRKLQEGEYPTEVVEKAIAYVDSYGYIDDLKFAENYITDKEGQKSPKRIEMDLLRKGIGKNIIEQAWNEWKKKGGYIDEEAMIAQLLKKRKFDPENADIKEKQKTYAFLMRKGFSAERIAKAMKYFAIEL